MTAIQEITTTINNIKTKGGVLSKNEILCVLEAAKSITKHTEVINSIIFLYASLDYSIQKKMTRLTKRELQILEQIGNGNNTKNIAFQLNLSISTIETHRKNIRKKLGLVGKGKLVIYAMLNNLTS